MFLPHVAVGFWPMISMGAILGGTMRSPFTGLVFAMELTHDFNSVLPLLIANAMAYGFTVLVLKRSILTEKIARRGFHLSREYSVDPLEILFVREVMRTSLVVFPGTQTTHELAASFRLDHAPRGQYLYPVVEGDRKVIGVMTRKDVHKVLAGGPKGPVPLREVARRKVVVAYADEPLRVVVNRMAETGLTRLLVVNTAEGRKLVGIVSLEDLLRARSRNLTEERHRERVLRLRLPFGSRSQAVG
jgi:CBS domain-containing protein